MRTTANPPAPAWAASAVSTNWDQLSTIAETPRWMPQYTRSKRGKFTFHDALGCGAFGCVFPTSTPSLVFKVTTDEAEATFVSTYLAEDPDHRPLGVVRYFRIVQLPGRYRNRPMYAIWREEAFNVGGVMRPIISLRERTYETVEESTASRRLSAFRGVSDVLRKILTQAKNRDKTAVETVKFYEDHYSDLEVDVDELSNVSYVYGVSSGFSQEVKRARRMYRGATMAAWCLRAMHDLAEFLENEHHAPLVGEALDHYLDRGIILADVHAGNFGRAPREDYGKPPVVITDPGHLIALPGAVVTEPPRLA